MSEKTKARLSKINCWCLEHSSDFAENLMRDLKSLKALFNYLFLALFVWVVVWLVLHNAETCGNTVVVTVGSVVTAIFTNYVWSSHKEKVAAGTFPAYPTATIPKPTIADTPDAAGDEGNG